MQQHVGGKTIAEALASPYHSVPCDPEYRPFGYQNSAPQLRKLGPSLYGYKKTPDTDGFSEMVRISVSAATINGTAVVAKEGNSFTDNTSFKGSRAF